MECSIKKESVTILIQDNKNRRKKAKKEIITLQMSLDISQECSCGQSLHEQATQENQIPRFWSKSRL